MRRVLFIITVLALALPSAAAAAPGRPTPTEPANGSVTPWVPALGWKAVSGADHYVFQMAADAGFNSPVEVSGDSVLETRNTYASWKTALPNGTYFWHVRGVDADGNAGPWSSTRSFKKLWIGSTSPISPTDGATLSYPKNPTMTWTPVAGAAKYEFTLASTPDMSSLDGKPAKAVETDASAFSVVTGLSASTTYYWSVTPIDAQGNRGVPSPSFSFTWQWNSTTVLKYKDLAPSSDVVDPQFSWNPIPNAARYQVEINSDAGFASGSKFCCTASTVATVLNPTNVLLNNTYYWRVRAVDPDGNFGVWNYYSDPNTADPFFKKTFDTRDLGDTNPSIQNLRMTDNLGGVDGNGSDFDGGLDGYQTQVPIVTWDPVLGASAYEVEVKLFTGGGCTAGDNSQYWDVIVGTNAWTPLGHHPLDEPWANHGRNLAHDGSKDLVPGNSYCVRVRAFTDQGYNQSHQLTNVVGDWSYIDNGLDPSGQDAVSFQFSGYPDDTTCALPDFQCGASNATAGDYLGEPTFGQTVDRTPLFTWMPTPGARGYFVLVSRDPSFTTVVDYAWTREPAYAPRFQANATTYGDETTSYYWVILPAAYATGVNPRQNPAQQYGGAPAPPDFMKESTPPALILPANDPGRLHPVTLRPTFEWGLVDWARTYTVQVAADPAFSDIIETVTTAASSYTPETNYPSDSSLFWRVRANDWNNIGLTWSSPRSFAVTVPKPTVAANNVTASQSVPTWTWNPVQGAISYDIEVQYPDGTKKLSKGYRTTNVTALKLDGSGLWHWKVRANFPTKNPTQFIQGPWSTAASFRNSMPAPSPVGTRNANGGLLFTWAPRVGAAHYQVEVSHRPDFGGAALERLKVDSPLYAPVLTNPTYIKGGQLYWRVAVVDDTGNVGEMTGANSIRLPMLLKAAVLGVLKKGKSGKITITVTDPQRHGVRGAKIVITGAGLRRKTVKTNSAGKVTVTLKPRKKGKITITVSKAGTNPIYRTVRVTTTVR